MAKTEKLFSKIMILFFLFLLVLGFIVPGFINQTETPHSSLTEPRVCQSDADCYLLCSGLPQPVMCLQNLCQQNSCEEKSFYQYDQNLSLRFTLNIDVNEEPFNLTTLSSPRDFFITFTGLQQVNLFSKRLSLNHVLDKINSQLTSSCFFSGKKYACSDETHTLQLFVNQSKSSAFGEYIPVAGDLVEIIYTQN